MKDAIVRALRGDAADALVTLAFDHVLAMNASQFIDAESLAGTMAATLKHSAASGQADEWIRGRIAHLKAAVPAGTLRDHIPTEITDPMRSTITLPVTPDREMVGRLLEHGAVENLLRDLLVGALQGFAKRLRPSVPGADRAGHRLKSLKRVSEGMLGGFGAELERQAEHKAREFVDSILNTVVAQAADDLCDPNKAESYGRFRGHLWDQFLDTPLADWGTEIDKIDPDLLISTANAAALALAARPSLQDELTSLIETAVSALGDQSLQDMLETVDVSNDWRIEAEKRAVTIVRSIAETEDFSTWLDTLPLE